MVAQRTAAYQITQCTSNTFNYIRTLQQARQEDDEDYRLLIPLDGEMFIRQHDQQTRLVPGGGTLFTLVEPFDLEKKGANSTLIATFPAREVNERLGLSAPLATGFDMTTGLGRVVNDVMVALFEEREVLTASQFDAVCDRLVELVCMLAAGDDRPDSPRHLADVESVVRRHIREHAADPDLNCAILGRSLGWSLRQVQVALQQAGTTPSELIREERLRLIRDRLRSPTYRHMSITELARVTGFSSVSALSTAFKRRFGMSPREARYGEGSAET
ncbi:AraC family transcriptional regulator [Nocardiopsis gilva YIM 90087]|uniref:AraC family transcriptional regulator n=1 Tax=Nocardiopsis gilva YIM 90087 TaxID=1235441 RepID=A0A223S195_9ACTN|nr:helix-turn-helix domain-containing protein [Nocardiopsis gilva]ASU81913.1 AraC family transcriptional regulator [Nocardiopsis gilva YIM 90087]